PIAPLPTAAPAEPRRAAPQRYAESPSRRCGLLGDEPVAVEEVEQTPPMPLNVDARPAPTGPRVQSRVVAEPAVQQFDGVRPGAKFFGRERAAVTTHELLELSQPHLR